MQLHAESRKQEASEWIHQTLPFVYSVPCFLLCQDVCSGAFIRLASYVGQSEVPALITSLSFGYVSQDGAFIFQKPPPLLFIPEPPIVEQNKTKNKNRIFGVREFTISACMVAVHPTQCTRSYQRYTAMRRLFVFQVYYIVCTYEHRGVHTTFFQIFPFLR